MSCLFGCLLQAAPPECCGTSVAAKGPWPPSPRIRLLRAASRCVPARMQLASSGCGSHGNATRSLLDEGRANACRGSIFGIMVAWLDKHSWVSASRRVKASHMTSSASPLFCSHINMQTNGFAGMIWRFDNSAARQGWQQHYTLYSIHSCLDRCSAPSPPYAQPVRRPLTSSKRHKPRQLTSYPAMSTDISLTSAS